MSGGVQAYRQGVELHASIAINAPAAAVWAVLGERFGHIGEWAAPILASSLAGEPEIGAERACRIARFGPVPAGVITERLVSFAPAAMSFAYEAVSGMPRFVRRAMNRWSVHPDGEQRCVVRSHATLELRGLVRWFGFAIRRPLRKSGLHVLEELRHWVERGEPHPRKVRVLHG